PFRHIALAAVYLDQPFDVKRPLRAQSEHSTLSTSSLPAISPKDEVGPRHPRAAEPPPALFLELNPALRARSNRRQKPAIHKLVFVVGPEQRHIARIAAIDAPKINAIWRAALVHRASDRRTGLAVGRNEASHGLVPLLLRQQEKHF